MNEETPRLVHIDTWVFDLDNTLYPALTDIWEQVDRKIGEAVSKFLSVPADQARVVQKDFLRRYGTTLRGLMVEHNIAPAEYLAFVHDIDLTAIDPNPRLDAALAALPGRKLVFTNATHAHAARVMERLGVAQRFEAVFDIHAAEYLAKPDPAVYDALLSRHGIDPKGAALFEDIARNLKPAHALGMTTGWVKVEWPWLGTDQDTSHVHHIIDDLTDWLTATAAALEKTAAR